MLYFCVIKSLLEHFHQTLCTQKGKTTCLPNHSLRQCQKNQKVFNHTKGMLGFSDPVILSWALKKKRKRNKERQGIRHFHLLIKLKNTGVESQNPVVCFQVHMNSEEPISSPLSPTTSDIEEIPFAPPAMSIAVSSKVSRMDNCWRKFRFRPSKYYVQWNSLKKPT